MRAAAYCGLNTAKVFYEPLSHACVVERFDRIPQDDGTLGRLIQYHFCQLAGINSNLWRILPRPNQQRPCARLGRTDPDGRKVSAIHGASARHTDSRSFRKSG